MHAKLEATIRPATPSDAAGIGAILRELGWFPHINSEAPAETESRAARRVELCLADDSHTILVAENSAGMVVGYLSVHWLPYAMLSGMEGFVSELFVLESERGSGVGRKLLDATKERALERECSRLHLVTGKGRGAYQFYSKLGWKERPEIMDFILPVG